MVDVTDSDFTLECLGSGHAPSIKWTKNGQDLSDQEFEKQEDTPETGGDYEYEQESGVRSRVKWKPPALDCDTVDRHEGQYKFIVSANAGGQDGNIEARFSLAVHCKFVRRTPGTS